MVTKKKTSKKKTKRKVAGRNPVKKKLPGWIILLSGVLFGLLIAVFGYINGWVPKPDNPNNKPVVSASATSQSQTIEDNSEDLVIKKKGNFDFYTSLPDMQVDIDTDEINQTTNRKPKSYKIQLGSFKKYADADAFKASVAFSGFTANIEAVKINEKQWFRVNIGPYNSSRKADKDKRILENNGFKPIVMKQ